MKTVELTISGKDPDLLYGIDDGEIKVSLYTFLDHGEYYTIRIEVARDGTIVGGKFL